MMAKDTQLTYSKVAEHTYMFGTKKIQAKVNNDILLVRVGGGYMNIEKFYDTYAE